MIPDPSFAKSLVQATIAEAGVAVVIAGQTYRATTESLQRRERELLMEGGVNAAGTDLRVFHFDPDLLTVWPPDGSQLSWNGRAYTVLLSSPEQLAGTDICVNVTAFRTPLSDAATDDPATVTTPGTGKREDFTPPDATF